MHNGIARSSSAFQTARVSLEREALQIPESTAAFRAQRRPSSMPNRSFSVTPRRKIALCGSAPFAVPTVSTVFPKQDPLSGLPSELLFLVVSHLTIRDVASLSMVTSSLSDICNACVLDSVRRFDAKEQGADVDALGHLLRRGNQLESIVVYKVAHSDPQITDRMLRLMNRTNCHALRSITLRGCEHLTDVGFKALGEACNKLVLLNLSHMRNLSSAALQHILSCNPFLRCIYLERSYNAVNDITLHTIATCCPNVRTLSLSHCVKISDRGIEFLADGCTTLRDLNLAHCSDLTAHGLGRLLQRSPWLKVLSLEWCINTTDQVLAVLSEFCPNLEALGIEHCTMISDEALGDLTRCLPKLTFLSADSCGFTGKVTCYSIANKLTTIRDLYLNSCSYINDECIDIISKTCKDLVHLGIEECYITDAGVTMLAERCGTLLTLGLNGNRQVTDKSVKYFIQRVPAVERFYLSHTGVTNDAVAEIAHCATGLTSFSLVDCDVDWRSLTLLGAKTNACRLTLRDLHLSNKLQYARHFYGDAFSEIMKDGKKNNMNDLSRAPFQSPMSTQHPRTIRSGANVQDLYLGGVLNLQQVIFPHPQNPKYKCAIFLR